MEQGRTQAFSPQAVLEGAALFAARPRRRARRLPSARERSWPPPTWSHPAPFAALPAESAKLTSRSTSLCTLPGGIPTTEGAGGKDVAELLAGPSRTRSEKKCPAPGRGFSQLFLSPTRRVVDSIGSDMIVKTIGSRLEAAPGAQHLSGGGAPPVIARAPGQELPLFLFVMEKGPRACVSRGCSA
jgi:hypothetical protein